MECTICDSRAKSGSGKIKCEECVDLLRYGGTTLNCEACNPDVVVEVGADVYTFLKEEDWSSQIEQYDDYMRDHPNSKKAQITVKWADIDLLEDAGEVEILERMKE